MTYKASLIDITPHKINWNYQTTHHFGDQELIENQYYEVKAKFSELLHPVVDSPPYRHSSSRSSLSGQGNNSPRSHTSSTQIKLPTIALPTFEGDTCSWLHYRDTFEALVFNNTIKCPKISLPHCFT